MSAAEFDALPYEEGRRWELLEGELVEIPGRTLRHQDIVYLVRLAIECYLETGQTEGLASHQVEFAVNGRSRLRPDVCVLVAEEARRPDPDRTPIPGAPDLAIEVISPTERAVDSYDKVRTYLQNGTTEVWQIFPKSRTMQIHRRESSGSIEPGQQVVSELLPGFTVPLASFFEQHSLAS
jgi:Uma2 family endonuclease